MFSRLSQLARHLSKPLPNYAHRSAAGGITGPRMTSAQAANNVRQIHTAGCLIIGDEVLGGKTVDTNSAYLAKFCFQLGISLKRVEVIPDDESDIIEAVKRKWDTIFDICSILLNMGAIRYVSKLRLLRDERWNWTNTRRYNLSIHS